MQWPPRPAGVGEFVPVGHGFRGDAEICGLNPALDVRNKTAVLAVDLVESLFGKSTVMRKPLVFAGALIDT